MAQALINVGTTPNDGTGDGIQIAGSKINDNFEELYAKPSVLSDIRFFGNKLVTQLSNADIVFEPSGTGSIIMANLRFNDNNIEAIRTNDNVNIIPNGTGGVKVAGIKVSTNEIQSWRSNDDIVFTPSGGGKVTFGALSFSGNNITSTRSNDDIKIIPAGTGSIIFDGIKFSGATISSDDSFTININEGLIVDGTLNVSGIPTLTGAVTMASTLDVASGLTTLASLTTTGSTTLTGTVSIDNLSFNDNTVGSSSNADINITPGGTGTVNITSLTVDSNIKLFDNKIQTILSNADIILSASGSGSVTIPKIDLNEGTMDAVIGDTTPAAGTFTTLTFDPANTGTLSTTGVTITDNDITSSLSNDNLEFRGSGTGGVSFNGLLLPNADGGTGQLLKTDGSGALSWGSSGIILGYSDIQDAKQTIGFASATQLTPNTAIIAHESIVGASASTIDSFDQTQYDSAWYLALTRMLSQDSSVEYSVAKYSILHGTSDGSTYDGFGSHSSITRTGDIEYFDGSTRTGRDAHIETSSDISESKLRILGQGGIFADGSTRSSVNAVTAYRIGLGDDDSSIAEGKATTVVHADLDSAEAAIDTWAHADYRGAKYFISVNNTTTNEVSNIECIVIHNGTTAFISSYNDIQSGNNSLITLNADINGSNVRLLGANGSAGTCRVTMYRILLADDESDSSGTYINVIGAKTVTNTGTTTIDTNSFRGTATPDMSSQKVISSFTNTDYDSTWYHAVTKDSTNVEWSMSKWSLAHGTTNDGSTKDAFITDSSEIRTSHTPLTVMDVNISGSTVQLLATANNDGSTTMKNAIAYYGIGLGDNTTTATSGKISTHAGVTIGGITETTIDHATASGLVTSLLASERTVASFTAGSYDSHWYFIVTRDLNGTSFEAQKVSLMHNLTDTWVTSSSVVRTDPADTHPTFDADITTSGDSTATVRLRATDSDGSTTPSNTMAYYRIGLGDDDSTGYTGEETDETTIAKATIGSTVANLDTWTASSNTAVKYFISINNLETGEVGNMEALLTHNDVTAYVSTYNETYSGSNSLLTVTADYDSGTVRLRGSATAGSNTRVTAYKILLADTESAETGTNTRTIANVTVSSTATAIDTFTDGNTGTESGYDACHYIVTGQRGSVKFVTEATVVTDGTNAYISQQGDVSTKSTPMLELTATHDGSSTVTVLASSTTGASTLVNAYRINLKAPTEQITTIDSWAHGSSRGAKYYIAIKETDSGYVSNLECLVTHDGSNAFLVIYNEHYSNSTQGSLVTLTVDISGTDVRLRGLGTIGNLKIKFYKIMLGDSESNASGTDANVIGAVTISSASTAIDTFVDTDYTGAHYIIVGYNSGETAASICEATVLTDGTTAFVNQGPMISSKETNQVLLTAAHDGSSTVTLSGASTSGGSTTVNAYRIHMLRGDGTAYDEVDEFASADYQGAHYVIVGKNAASESQILELTAVTDGVGAYITETGPNISTHSTTTPLMDFTAVYDESKLKLRAENTQEGTTTTLNAWRVHLARADGDTSGIKVLDTWSATTYRSAKYTISISDTSNGRYESLDLNVTHDGTNAYLATFGNVTNHTSSLVTFTATIVSGEVNLTGQISNTDTHEITVIRRVIKI